MNIRFCTIQIFQPDGDLSGGRIAELTTSIVRLIELPRSELPKFTAMPEARQIGLCFLISDEGKEELYIGQSGEVDARLLQHHKNESRDWKRALVLVSMTNNLNQTHVLYLESLSIEKARECDRYELLNGNSGQKPNTPTPLKADCDEIHELGSLLLTSLGYPVLESINKTTCSEEQELFYCTRAKVDARALFTNQGMVVLKGSSAPFETNRQVAPRLVHKRDELLEKGILAREGNRFVFQRDYLFKTPSGTSCQLLQASSNGWLDWKTKNGVTLNDYQGREAVAASAGQDSF